VNLHAIQHTVVFRLRHARDSDEERDFLERAWALGELPGVQRFQVLDQVGQKNDYDFCLSMHFASQQAYDAYDAHPEHRRFVQEVWLPQVAQFLELDYVERR